MFHTVCFIFYLRLSSLKNKIIILIHEHTDHIKCLSGVILNVYQVSYICHHYLSKQFRGRPCNCIDKKKKERKPDMCSKLI